MLWLLILLAAIWWFFSKPQPTDETAVQKLTRENPGLVPVNTVSVDPTRMVFFDPMNYSGRVVDASC